LDTPQIGYVKEYTANTEIVILRMYNVQRDTVDAIVADVKEEFLNWPHPVWRAVLDMRNVQGIITPYAVSGSRVIMNLRPELPGRLAVVINNRIAAQIISTTIRVNLNTNRKRLLFADENEAINWLLK
jgi:tRNA isopentenyl-2-thiomethyl-A-37 hydroxylase MiaE